MFRKSSLSSALRKSSLSSDQNSRYPVLRRAKTIGSTLFDSAAAASSRFVNAVSGVYDFDLEDRHSHWAYSDPYPWLDQDFLLS